MTRKLLTLVLFALIVATGASKAQAASQTDEKVIPIVARRFAFGPDHITLKRGEAVTLRLTSEDVTHGFFARALKLDELIEPGKPVEIKVKPETAGTFTVICHHFCGSGHGNMKMTITVE